MFRSEPKQVANAAVRGERDKIKRRDLLLILGVLSILLVPFLFYIGEGIEVVRAGYRIEELKAERTQLADRNRVLKIEKAKLRNPQRIEQVAKDKLGLVYPQPGSVVHVNASSDALRPGADAADDEDSAAPETP